MQKESHVYIEKKPQNAQGYTHVILYWFFYRICSVIYMWRRNSSIVIYTNENMKIIAEARNSIWLEWCIEIDSIVYGRKRVCLFIDNFISKK